MSMSRCKCGKIFDTDFELGIDEKGNCACDNCAVCTEEDAIAMEQEYQDNLWSREGHT